MLVLFKLEFLIMYILNQIAVFAVQSIVVYPYETFYSVHSGFSQSVLKRIQRSYCYRFLYHIEIFMILSKIFTWVTWLPHFCIISLSFRSASLLRSIRNLAAFSRLDSSVSGYLWRLFVEDNWISSIVVSTFLVVFVEFFCVDPSSPLS